MLRRAVLLPEAKALAQPGQVQVGQHFEDVHRRPAKPERQPLQPVQRARLQNHVAIFQQPVIHVEQVRHAPEAVVAHDNHVCVRPGCCDQRADVRIQLVVIAFPIVEVSRRFGCGVARVRGVQQAPQFVLQQIG